MRADDELRASLANALGEYPAFGALVPVGTLRSRKITNERMEKYGAVRLDRYFHQLNLPLLLHGALFAPNVKLRVLLRSLLRTLDDFSARFRDTPGARSFLAPLWLNMWTATPELWSVVSGAYMALSYQANGIPVLGFESKICGDDRDEARDDITVTLANATTHIEIEVWHSASFKSLTDEALHVRLLARADQKAAKFRNLAPSRCGVVAVVCVIADGDEDRCLDLPVAHIPGRPPNILWSAYRLLGMYKGEDYRFGVKPFEASPRA